MAISTQSNFKVWKPEKNVIDYKKNIFDVFGF